MTTTTDALLWHTCAPHYPQGHAIPVDRHLVRETGHYDEGWCPFTGRIEVSTPTRREHDCGGDIEYETWVCVRCGVRERL